MQRTQLAIAGMIAAALSLGTGHVVAGLMNPAASPVVAVGEAAIDRVPPFLKDWAVATFGTADKTVLVLVVLVAVLAIGAVAGLAGGRRPAVATGVVVLLAGVGAVTALTRPGGVTLDVVPSLAAGAAGFFALQRLLPLAVSQRSAEAPDPAYPLEAAVTRDGTVPRGYAADPGRRRFLLLAGGLAAAAAVLGAAGQSLGRTIARVVLPAVAQPAAPLAAGVEPDLAGLSPLRTPTEDFYRIDTVVSVPRIDPDTWKLSVDGLVEHPFTLTLAELLAMPLVERDITLTCVSNSVGGDLVGSTRWTGVLVADLLRRASPAGAADMVLSTSQDGWTASTPLDVLLDGRDAMLAVGMDGEPLTPTHGSPVRLLTPGLYGYVGATKWLTKLTVTTFEADKAYWTVRGWSERGPVKTSTRIDTPTSTVKAGDAVIAGVSWATHRGISRVQVQVDDGEWRDATLGADVGLDYWRQWYLPWQATPGKHRLTARSYDGAGEVQTDKVAYVIPDGAAGYHSVTVTVT